MFYQFKSHNFRMVSFLRGLVWYTTKKIYFFLQFFSRKILKFEDTKLDQMTWLKNALYKNCVCSKSTNTNIFSCGRDTGVFLLFIYHKMKIN